MTCIFYLQNLLYELCSKIYVQDAMFTEVDNRNGLVKTYWPDIQARVAKVAPKFAQLINELDPDRSFPVYLCYLPYGALKGDTVSPFMPTCNGGSYRLSDPNAPKDVIKHLGYGMHSSPLGMVLEKKLEYFVDIKDEGITMPWTISKPGTFFPLARTFESKSNRIYSPNGVLTVSSGVRSTFMLPNIGCQTHHANLQRDFNIQLPAPKSLYEHWHIFRNILNNPIIKTDWRSCIIYFSEKWQDKIQHDERWLAVKACLHEQAWNVFEFERNRIYYEIAYSIIQKKRNLKPNPYLVDTARHLFTTALGAAPGYVPASDDDSLPANTLREIFINSYGLKKYYPTIIHAEHFSFETDSSYTYYSLQNPSTYIASPKSRKMSSTLVEMRELENIMRIFVDELSKENSVCSDTIIHNIARDIKFNYFHNKPDRHKVVKPSNEIAEHDSRFNNMAKNHKLPGAKFAADAPFVRGCISISKKNDSNQD